jgi:carboxyl-terminal processing protease
MDRVVVQTTLAALGGVILVLLGVWLGGHPGSLPGPLRESLVEEDRAAQAELAEEIQDNFYKEVDEDKLDQGALDGMVRALDDRFSQYITDEQAEIFRQSVSGEFEGVGLSVEKDNRGLLVVRVFDGSPAQRGGVRKDDVVVEVNGESIAGEATQVATGKIKGPAGTSVELTVLTPRSGRRREVKLKRARIEVPVVEGRLAERGGRKLAHVELLGFSEGAHGELRREIDDLRERGAEGVLLDLRGNPGGLLREAVLVSSVFIEDGRIVSTKGRTKPERVFEAEGDAIDGSIPVVVLVDNGSASASEIVTGALRDRRRATVVGRRTFGKGVFQEVEELSNGALLDLTVGSYYLPGGENISDKGITPEVPARDKPRTKRDEALPVALRQLLEETE